MPTVRKRPTPQPLLQISWFTRKNGRTTTVVFSVGFPLVAGMTLLLQNAHLDIAKKMVKAFAGIFGVGP